ncbi:MAG: phosphate starvation-inducible protein PsiF [Burkholderiaceae bacterium]|nr:MAG: phosphate starvation-inducible protein PsiF [Burkholderiaceae bacterium]
MKQLLPLIAAMGLALSMGMGVAHAAEGAKTAQQSKMASCNKDAAGKKGDERKAFMKDCLSAKPAAAAPAATPSCDQAAAEKKLAGAAKASFVKKCMADAK